MDANEVLKLVAERNEKPSADQPAETLKFRLGCMIGDLINEDLITIEESRLAINELRSIDDNEAVIAKVWD